MLKEKSKKSSTMQNDGGGQRSPLVEKFIRFCESDFGKRVMDIEANYIRKELSGCSKILDVGCGIGSIEERLPDLNIVGLERSEEMLREARRRSDKTFIYGDAYSMPFPDWSFDGVFFVTTLEFLDNYMLAVVESARVLKRDGKIVVMMLNPESEYFKAHYAKEGDYFRNIKHIDYTPIVAHLSNFFQLNTGYFLGVEGENVSIQGDRNSAALFVIKGTKL